MEQSTKEKNTRQSKRNSIYNNETVRQRPMISFEEVSKKYQNGVEALRHLSFRIEEGEFVFLMGSSGAGKSTLIKLILLEERPSSGRIYVNTQNLEKIKRSQIQKYRRSIGVFFQDFRLLPDRNVYENVAFAQRVVNRPTRVIRKRVPEVLQEVGLAVKYKSFPDELSGGEQQRVALARALVNRPDILLADEPTGNLDSKTTMEVLQLMQKIVREQNQTLVMVTHDNNLASYITGRF